MDYRLDPRRIIVWIIFSIVVLVVIWGLYMNSKVSLVSAQVTSAAATIPVIVYGAMVVSIMKDNYTDENKDYNWANFVDAVKTATYREIYETLK